MKPQNLVANLYNPHEQTKEQLIDSFVVRRNVFQKLFKEIKSSDMKYPEQHFLIVGQRGMGKTTLLLRLGYEVENDRDLHSWLIPLVLKEESYWGITRLFKLWETIAKELENKDKNFSGLFAKMESAYSENADYERIIFDILIQELQTHSRKLLLFIDNLAEMFRNFSDMECHRLREILMTCPHLRMIGATAIVLEAFFKYEHAFYEFFKKEHLEGLNKEETRCLLEQLAKTDAEKKTIAHILEHQQGRAEALRIMTGGVLRTIILLFEIFIDNENGNAIGDLESILDRVTPLYKHRMDDLAPMQREVVNAIALNWDAISTEEIAKKMRMKTEEILPVLQGLDKVEIIQRAAADTQLNLYFLKERFFNIWYLMRVAPKGSQNKVIWLVRFLESWYDKEELTDRAKRHIDALYKGDYHPKGAYYMTEALAWTCKLDMDIEDELKTQTRKFLEKRDKKLANELSQSDYFMYSKGLDYNDDDEYENALNEFLQIKNKNADINFCIGVCYCALSDYQKAEEYYLMSIKLEPYANHFEGVGNFIKNIHTTWNSIVNLVYMYFMRKIKKDRSLYYAEQGLEQMKKIGHEIQGFDSIFFIILGCIYLWNNKFENAIKVADKIIYSNRFYDLYSDFIEIYFLLLLAKQQYQHVAQYFEDPKLNLKERFKPLYYALLHFTGNKDFHKMPPELAEPVKDIIEKVKQMAVDYA